VSRWDTDHAERNQPCQTVAGSVMSAVEVALS